MKFRTTASHHAQGHDLYLVQDGVVDMPASVGAAFGLEPVAESEAKPKKGEKSEKAEPEAKPKK